MLHLIPNHRYTDLCTKAIESILKTYDLGHNTKDFKLCDRWDLDKLIDAQTIMPVVIKNVVPGQLCDYLVEAEIGKLYDTFYWQLLPTDAWEADRVVAELEPLLVKNVNVQFLLPMTISQQQWYEMFATGMKTKTMQTLAKYGKRISVLEPLEMSTLVYTLPDQSKHRSLMVAATRLAPKTRMAVMEVIGAFVEPLDEILAEYRRLPELF
jgi:hypothetical protein